MGMFSVLLLILPHLTCITRIMNQVSQKAQDGSLESAVKSSIMFSGCKTVEKSCFGVDSDLTAFLVDEYV